jgi:hypothetical protein
LPSAVNSLGNGDAVAGLVADLERGALGQRGRPQSRSSRPVSLMKRSSRFAGRCR